MEVFGYRVKPLRMVVFGYRVGPLLRKTGREILDDGVLGLAAQTAYYFFFSLFPILLFSAPLLSLAGDRQQVYDTLFGQLAAQLPPGAAAIIDDVLRDVVFSEAAPGLMSLGALLALWAGSNIFSALIDALNRAYDVEERRQWWKRRLIAIAAVAVAGLVMVMATLLFLASEGLLDWLGRTLGFDAGVRAAWLALQVPIAFTLLVGLAWMLFFYLPNVRQSPRGALVGALVTTVLWMLVTLVFRLYVVNFANYNKTYGTIGGVIVLLTWMYLSMLSVLAGGELAAEVHHGTGAVRPRSGVTLGGRILAGSSKPSTARVRRLTKSGGE